MTNSSEEPSAIHVPVLPAEVMKFASAEKGQVWVDGTAGAGGHSLLLAEALGEEGHLLALDRDPQAAQRLCTVLPENCSIFNESYHRLPEVLAARNLQRVHGILLDLGLSSDQLADRERGFSFQFDGPLDMRFDPTTGVPAWQWLAQSEEETIANAIYKYGEERFSRRIARQIVLARKTNPIRNASQLRELILKCIPAARKTTKGSLKHGRVDPATRTFQALRIVVNQELEILEQALKSMPDSLEPDGKLLVISFHSLEDRIVKYAFREDPRLEIVTRKPVVATEAEIQANSRSRSAKLRVARLESQPPTNASH